MPGRRGRTAADTAQQHPAVDDTKDADDTEDRASEAAPDPDPDPEPETEAGPETTCVEDDDLPPC